MVSYAAVAFLATVTLCVILTWVVRRVAPRLGLTDRPDKRRKLHNGATPLGGGVAVFMATAVVLGIVTFTPNPWGFHPRADWPDLIAFFGAGLWIVVLGCIDDRYQLRGRHKLLGQLVAAGILISSGLAIHSVGVFGHTVPLGMFAIPLSALWFVGTINAVNLLDGVDGMATTIGVILCLSLAVLAALTGHYGVAFVALVFAGALLGFLWFNLPPASIFLGDSGSMLIGLMIGAMAVRASLKGAGTVLLAAPLALCMIPILDSAAAIVRRKLTGRSIFAADRGHLHHQLMQKLGDNYRVLVVVAALCVTACLGALASVALTNDMIAFATVGCVLVLLVATGLFGRGEAKLVLALSRRIARGLLRPLRHTECVDDSCVQLQGAHSWDTLWLAITQNAERCGVVSIQLDITISRIHEAFSGNWHAPSNGHDESEIWQVRHPLRWQDEVVGSLRVKGSLSDDTPMEEIVAEMKQMVEEKMALLTDSRDASLSAASSRAPAPAREAQTVPDSG